MISALFGVPGAGKSLGLAWVARRALRKPNRPIYLCGHEISSGHSLVFSNFYLDGCYKLNYADLGKYRFEDCLILIDEIMMYSDSRDYKSFSSDLKFFFSQHRKFDIDIVWTSQSYDDSDKKIRNLTNNFFLIEHSRIPNFSRVTHIAPFFDILDYTPRSGYSFGVVQRFYRPPLYKLVDSFSTVSRSKDSLPLPTLTPWTTPLLSNSDSQTINKIEVPT